MRLGHWQGRAAAVGGSENTDEFGAANRRCADIAMIEITLKCLEELIDCLRGEMAATAIVTDGRETRRGSALGIHTAGNTQVNTAGRVGPS